MASNNCRALVSLICFTFSFSNCSEAGSDVSVMGTSGSTLSACFCVVFSTLGSSFGDAASDGTASSVLFSTAGSTDSTAGASGGSRIFLACSTRVCDGVKLLAEKTR